MCPVGIQKLDRSIHSIGLKQPGCQMASFSNVVWILLDINQLKTSENLNKTTENQLGIQIVQWGSDYRTSSVFRSQLLEHLRATPVSILSVFQIPA